MSNGYCWPISDVKLTPNEEAVRLAELIVARAQYKWLCNYHTRLVEGIRQKRMMRPVPFGIVHTEMMLEKVKQELDKRRLDSAAWQC